MRVCDLRANGRFARKQKARGGVYVGGRASGGVRCVALVCGACGYQRGASIHTGWAPPPPVGAPNQGMPPFSKIFFIFFEEGAISREIWDRCRVINIVKA